MRSYKFKIWAGLLVSALFVYLALRNIDSSELWSAIKSSNLRVLLFAALVTVFQNVIRVWRWNLLLEPIKKTCFRNRIYSVFIGFAANCVLPARLGEFIRANYLGNCEKISSSSAFGTIVIERLFDGYTLLLVLFIGLVGTTFPENLQIVGGSLRGAGLFLLCAYSLAIVFLFGFKSKTGPFLNLLDRVLFFLSRDLRSRIRETIQKFSLGLVLLSPSGWLRVAFYSCLLWAVHLYQIELIGRAAGLSLPFVAAFLLLAMASFGVMIPSAPGFIGTFHLSVQYGFMFYGVSPETGLSAAILWHAVSFFPTIFIGLLCFILLQVSRKEIQKPVRLGIDKI